ncbi:RLA class II histocompatibility antigen, DP alpha-1 chain-like [Trematomus bernacchii]|uniref:RLA class II histocompatibility antigen, DP alpha-1 chain-like n=1 Tax=Trematomus bernacchii TaxID=40690 RepID=UPI00146F0B74|nr:RLA class II histocompatibility antigen, DP alpha-1 chain-like [Trematomus bernacchii]
MMMMMMMKMMMLLFLCGILCVSADVPHDHLQFFGCSDSDGEYMFALDAEELYYADFKAGKIVDAQPSFVEHLGGSYEFAQGELQTCRFNLGIVREFYKNVSLEKDPPSTPLLYTKQEVEMGEGNVLVCHVTGFYPAPVSFFWTKNGENVTEGTSINVPFLSKEGSFSQFSRLEFTPQLGDIYSCGVQHLALDQPLTTFWEEQGSQPGVGPAVFCALGLTVGLLGVAAGTFFLIKGNECS